MNRVNSKILSKRFSFQIGSTENEKYILFKTYSCKRELGVICEHVSVNGGGPTWLVYSFVCRPRVMKFGIKTFVSKNYRENCESSKRLFIDSRQQGIRVER